MSKQKNPRFTTPKGVAVYPRLNEPDTKFDADGTFNCKLAFEPDAEGVQELKEKLEAIRDEEFKAFISENPKKKNFKVADVFTEELDEEGDPTGRIILNMKMKHKVTSKKNQKTYTFWPKIFDGMNQELKNPPQIGGGSILRGSFEVFGAPVDSSKTFHLSIRMLGVKIISLVTGGASASGLGFGDDDDADFAADEENLKPARASSDEDSGSDSKGSGGGDF